MKTLFLSIKKSMENNAQIENGNPLKVVQMLPELESGGVERGTLELGKYLASLGHHSMVISGGGRLVEQLEREGSRHVGWSVGSKSPRSLAFWYPLRLSLIHI